MKEASNPTTATLYVVLSLSLLTIGLAPLAAAAPTPDTPAPAVDREHQGIPLDLPRGEHGPPECVFADQTGERTDDPILCPDPVPENGAACVSHGLVIIERDFTGVVGDVSVVQSTSRADAHGSEGPELELDPFDGDPEADPDAHADAQQVGFSYTHTSSGLAIDASVIDSRCDVSARATFPPMAASYGEAGIADLEVTHFGSPLLSAGALQKTVDAISTDGTAKAGHSCEILRLQIVGSGPTLCPPANTGTGLGPVSFTLNEVWGPFTSGAQQLYGGAAAHITIFGVGQVVDVYLGYTAVSVPGWDAEQPDPI